MNFTKKVLLIVLFLIVAGIYYSLSSNVNSSDTVQLRLDPVSLNYDEMLVSFLPLSIGEATIIQFPNNDFYLIDTGHNTSSKELINYLLKYGVQRLKGVIISNSSEEHFGGFEAILQQIPVDAIYLPDLIANSFKIEDIDAGLINTLKVNDQLYLYPNAMLTVLAPSEPLSLSPQVNSLVFQLTHNQFNILFTSDINTEVEKRLVDQFALKSEILKVSDFGSNQASLPEFLREVDPQVGIIFSSDPELYKLSDDVLERLSESWADVYILEKMGEIKIVSKGKDYNVEIIRPKD